MFGLFDVFDWDRFERPVLFQFFPEFGLFTENREEQFLHTVIVN